MKYKAYKINGETYQQDKTPFMESNSYAELQNYFLESGFTFKGNNLLTTARGFFVKGNEIIIISERKIKWTILVSESQKTLHQLKVKYKTLHLQLWSENFKITSVKMQFLN